MGIESYIAVPLMRPDGSFFGTLCALDPLPAKIDDASLSIFRLLADLITFELDAEERETERDREFAEAQREALFRERFMAILGHDLRTPLTAIAISAGAMRRRGDLDEAIGKAITRISNSASQMDRMIADLLDLTQSRLGGGIPVQRTATDLNAGCEAVIAVHDPDHRIAFEPCADATGDWDPDRISQLVGNLIENAMRHSEAGTPVVVRTTCDAHEVRLTVENRAGPLGVGVITTLFDPFRRGVTGAHERAPEGLGLGLYIAQQIVAAHDGRIDVTSSDGSFTARAVLPRRGRG